MNKTGDNMTGDLEVDGTVTAKEFARNVIGNATSTTRLKTSQNINGISFNGTYNVINYAICSTEADVSEKTVTCSGFSLITGADITIKFMVTNTAANPTLNVNGTGAKPIYYRGVPIAAENVPFYRLTKDNMDTPPAPTWNGGFSIGMGVMEDNSMPVISFSVMGYHLQFSFSEVNVVKRMKHQSNPWSE